MRGKIEWFQHIANSRGIANIFSHSFGNSAVSAMGSYFRQNVSLPCTISENEIIEIITAARKNLQLDIHKDYS